MNPRCGAAYPYTVDYVRTLWQPAIGFVGVCMVKGKGNVLIRTRSVVLKATLRGHSRSMLHGCCAQSLPLEQGPL